VELGNVDAMSNLAHLYDNGEGVKLDKKKAAQLWRMAADRGDASAQQNVALVYFNAGRFAEAIRFYKRAAEQGLSDAQYSLAVCFEQGKGTEVDLAEAKRWYRKGVDRGEAQSRNNLAGLLGAEGRHRESFELVKLSAQQGYAVSETNLGLCYEFGRGTSRNPEEARRCYASAAAKGCGNAAAALERIDAESAGLIPPRETPAAYLARLRHHAEDKNDPEALTTLAGAYRAGKFGLVKSTTKAAELYERAAELGEVHAMVNLGMLLRTGDGVNQDREKMFQLYRSAADRGFAWAQLKLGSELHQDGKDEEAFPFLKLSAEQGNATAELFVGYYLSGLWPGVPQDRAEAIRWFERAAAKGDEGAIRALASELVRT